MLTDLTTRNVNLDARPASARAARIQVRAWLASASWPDSQIDDIVYAVNEAVTNAIEHAYSRPATTNQTVEVTLRVRPCFGGTCRAQVEVLDQGHWQPFHPQLGSPHRGLMLMRATMDEVAIRPGDRHAGTVVELLSPPIPQPSI